VSENVVYTHYTHFYGSLMVEMYEHVILGSLFPGKAMWRSLWLRFSSII
jgi:hypothetical protein